ncbi:unnamed protein product, partial [Nesidiocoris tenuis]
MPGTCSRISTKGISTSLQHTSTIFFLTITIPAKNAGLPHGQTAFSGTGNCTPKNRRTIGQKANCCTTGGASSNKAITGQCWRCFESQSTKFRK